MRIYNVKKLVGSIEVTHQGIVFTNEDFTYKFSNMADALDYAYKNKLYLEPTGEDEVIKDLRNQIEDLKEKLEKANRRRSKIPKEKENEILTLRKLGFGMNKIAKKVGCGDGTVKRVLKDYEVE